jgi:hypothetical protein
MVFLSWDSQVGVPKLRQMGLPQLWSSITLRTDFKSRCVLKKSCSSRRELSNGMSHTLYNQVNWVDSWFFLVKSQTGNLTPGPSFGHNLCFRCPNENSNPFQTSRFQEIFNDIKNVTSHWVLAPKIALWNFGSPPGLHLLKWELPCDCEGSLPHTLSHFLTLQRVCDVTPGLLLGPHPCGLFALIRGLPFGP